MRTAIDSAGRVVIPKPLRERAAFRPGAELDARLEDGRIVLEHRAVEVNIRKRGAFFVAEPVQPVPVLRQAEVEAVLDDIRSERGAASTASSRARRKQPVKTARAVRRSR